MDLQEDAVGAGDDAGGGHQRDEARVAARDAVGAARALHRVGGVHHHRAAAIPHQRDGAEVDHQVVVAEEAAALGEHDAAVAGLRHLAHGQRDVGRAHHLALLDVQRQASAGGGDQQVGLAAEEGRDLDDRQHRGGLLRLPGLVDVGEDRHPDLLLDARQDGQPLGDARAARRGVGSAVGLVERGLEDIGDAELAGDLLGLGRDLAGQPLVLDDAGAGDEEETAVGDLDVVDLEERLHKGHFINISGKWQQK